MTKSARSTAAVAAILCFSMSMPLSSQAEAQANQAAYDFARRLGGVIERCWFGPGSAEFANYVYSPEPNAAGGPRILIVPRGSPHELPVLVIEVAAPAGAPRLNVYGPLAATAQANRIATDLRRWMGGSDSCG